MQPTLPIIFLGNQAEWKISVELLCGRILKDGAKPVKVRFSLFHSKNLLQNKTACQDLLLLTLLSCIESKMIRWLQLGYVAIAC